MKYVVFVVGLLEQFMHDYIGVSKSDDNEDKHISHEIVLQKLLHIWYTHFYTEQYDKGA